MATPRIPEGKYRARAKSAEFGFTSTGSEQVLVTFDLLDPDYDGETVPWWGYFTEKTSERTMQSLRYCGWMGDDVTNLDGINANEVELVIEHNTFKDKTNARVAWVNRLGGGVGMKAPMPEAKKAEFAKRMKALAIKTRKDIESRPAPQIDPADDVGF